MLKELKSPRFIFASILITLIALTRLLPHEWNFSPVVAIALFGGALLGNKFYAFAIPMLALFISDLLIGFYNPWTMIAVYGCFALMVGGGMLLKNLKPLPIFGMALLSSIIFFLVTNFAVWPGNPLYPQTFGGLILCYEAGIPFFRGTVTGALFYSTILFGSYYLATLRFPQLKAVRA